MFGGSGPAASLGATFYPLRGQHFAFGPMVRFSVFGMFVHFPAGDSGTGIYVSPRSGSRGPIADYRTRTSSEVLSLMLNPCVEKSMGLPGSTCSPPPLPHAQ